MDGQQQEAVQQFCSSTAATPEKAKFYLESCIWQLDTAIHSFFENEASIVPEFSRENELDDGEETPHSPPRVAAAAAPSSVAANSGRQAQGQGRWEAPSSGPFLGTGAFGGTRPKSGKDKGAAKSNGGRGGITTLSDPNRDPDSASDSDGPQEHYTGGEKSGMMEQDPSRGHRDVDMSFERARQFGAREGVVEAPPPASRTGVFSGKKEKINAIWEQLNAKSTLPAVGRSTGIPAFGVASSRMKIAEAATKSTKAVPSWMVNLGIAPRKPSSVTDDDAKVNQPSLIEEIIQKQDSITTPGVDAKSVNEEMASKEEIRRIAAAALASAKAATKASTDGKMEISEIRDFAGEEVRITKFVDPNSKAAVAARKRAEMQAASSSGLDALLQQIGKKQKLNILDKSRKDWGEFKEDKGLEVELEMHKKSGDTYTEKVAFLQRSDMREYEQERDARLALLTKRRSDSAPVD